MSVLYSLYTEQVTTTRVIAYKSTVTNQLERRVTCIVDRTFIPNYVELDVRPKYSAVGTDILVLAIMCFF